MFLEDVLNALIGKKASYIQRKREITSIYFDIKLWESS